MPPPAVKTVRDLIYWQYAKIISNSGGFGKTNWRFTMKKFKELKEGKISWNKIREHVIEHERKDQCIYCGKSGNLTIDHLLPRIHGGPDTEKNIVWVCKSCNSKKGSKRLYEFFVSLKGLKGAKYGVPRIAEGKYLKFIYDTLEEKGLLDWDIKKITELACKKCELKNLCIRENTVEKLSPLCLDGIITMVFKGII